MLKYNKNNYKFTKRL